MRAATTPNDAHGEFTSWIVGSGILLVQLCAVVPGLLPGLLILVVLGLPVLVLGAAGGLLYAASIAIARLARAIARRARRKPPRAPASPGGRKKVAASPTSLSLPAPAPRAAGS